MYYLKRINNVLNGILAPIRNYPISMVFLTGLLLYPEISFVFTSGYSFVSMAKSFITAILLLTFNNLLITTAFIYIGLLLAFAFSKIKNWLGTIVLCGVHFVVYALVLSNEFLNLFFGSHINAMMVKLLCETHPTEANDFATTYLANPKFYVFVACALFVLIAEVLTSYGYHRFKATIHNKFSSINSVIFKAPVAIYILLAICYLIYLHPVFSTDWRQNYIFIEENRLSLCHPNTEYSFPWSVNLAVVQYIYEQEDKERSVASQSLAGDASVEPGNIPNIVVIIGESFNRHHASTYGYPLPTCAYTDSIDGVCAYTDVITSYNVTANALSNMFSVASVADSLNWCDAPFFPAVFKNAGFNVVFWSNHYISETTSMGNGNFSGNFFTHPVVREKCFSYWNAEKRQYDGEFLDYYKAKRDSVEKSDNNLIFLHVAGQHVDPTTHFPPSRTKFTINDYKYRKELSNEEKQQVANYDNCTLYVDSVVAEVFRMYSDKDAIVFYIPDHGDEANDFQPHIGRSYQLEKLGAPCLHCQFDIPFLVYMSPVCRQKHPNQCHQIEQCKNRPFMTDDLPHLLFDLAGIRTQWYKPTLSPLSVDYNMTPNRIVSDNIEYDRICSSYGKWQIGY